MIALGDIMMMNNKEKIDELKQKISDCEAYAEKWKSCNDGSDGMALDHRGYWEYRKQLELLMASENSRGNDG